MKVFSGLVTASYTVFLLGMLIAGISAWNAFASGKTGRDRAVAILIGTLAIALLVVQFVGNKLSSFAAKSQSDQLQKRLIDASLGSDAYPTLMADRFGNQRPCGLSVFNPDKDANIYDLVLYVQEGEHTSDGQGFRTLQQRTLRYPIVPPGCGSASIPFEFLSQRNTSYLQFDLSTRRKICSGLIVLKGDGHGNWVTVAYPVHEGPLTAHQTEIPERDQS